MIEAYKIGVTLTLKGDAQQKLAQFTQTSKRAAEAVEKLNSRMRPLYDSFSKIDVFLSKINPRMDRLAYAFGDSRKNLTGLNQSFTGFNEKMNAAIGKTESLIVKTDRLKRELAGLGEAGFASSAGLGALAGVSVNKIGGGGRHGSGGHGGGFGGMHYKGVGFGALGFTPGMAAVGLAFAGAYGIKAGYDESKTYQQALAQFLMMNSGTTSGQANAFINGNNIKGVSNIQLLQALTDAMVVTKNFKEAAGLAPTIAQIEYSDRAIFGNAMPRSQYMDLIRVAEMKSGSKDVAKLSPEIERMQKVKSSSGGRVLPSDYRLLLKRAGVAGKTASDDFLYYGLEPIIQEQGGSSTGQQLMSVYSALVGGRMTTASAIRFDQLGLIKPGGAEFNKIGMIKRLKPGGVVGNDLASTNLEQWVYSVYLPALMKHGITTIPQQLKEVSVDFSNRNAANLVSLLIMQESKILANIDANKRGAGVAQSVAIASGLATGKEQQLSASYSKFKQSLGAATTGQMVGAIVALTKILNFGTDIVELISGFLRVTGKATAWIPSFDQTWDKTSQIIHSAVSNAKVNTVPPSGSNTTQVHTTINLDSKPLVRAVTMHQGNDALRSQETGMSAPNPYISPMTSGYIAR